MAVCEIENKFVMDRLAVNLSARLPNRTYDVMHSDAIDERSIDVALLYDPSLFDAPADQRSSSS